jgi:hypothetical protein
MESRLAKKRPGALSGSCPFRKQNLLETLLNANPYGQIVKVCVGTVMIA